VTQRGNAVPGGWEYRVTFKVNTLVRTSFSGLVRQVRTTPLRPPPPRVSMQCVVA